MNDSVNNAPGSPPDPRLLQRLQELKSEYDAGQKQVAILETRTQELRSTLLRISGAIQVLEELVAAAGPGGTNGREP